ncbi:uncharacterized protein BDR25DRAFT_360419 [Lindgomyces ingoldianus]|uniref:Uncharacterized protein n=1 Tax=Lindgomyces ingoldianus TaxID=673940 RepID=A0ACB6QEZ2_9PLEO|nr:uncharacterized protein BDR25DRAFT_360419 [Lindgomyces ingoldianus]KAF2465461.1 hypothetical protein BDR25DRAFT_360419 [Lindgomyces ingoldianus]
MPRSWSRSDPNCPLRASTCLVGLYPFIFFRRDFNGGIAVALTLHLLGRQSAVATQVLTVLLHAHAATCCEMGELKLVRAYVAAVVYSAKKVKPVWGAKMFCTSADADLRKGEGGTREMLCAASTRAGTAEYLVDRISSQNLSSGGEVHVIYFRKEVGNGAFLHRRRLVLALTNNGVFGRTSSPEFPQPLTSTEHSYFGQTPISLGGLHEYLNAGTAAAGSNRRSSDILLGRIRARKLWSINEAERFSCEKLGNTETKSIESGRSILWQNISDSNTTSTSHRDHILAHQQGNIDGGLPEGIDKSRRFCATFQGRKRQTSLELGSINNRLDDRPPPLELHDDPQSQRCTAASPNRVQQQYELSPIPRLVDILTAYLHISQQGACMTRARTSYSVTFVAFERCVFWDIFVAPFPITLNFETHFFVHGKPVSDCSGQMLVHSKAHPSQAITEMSNMWKPLSHQSADNGGKYQSKKGKAVIFARVFRPTKCNQTLCMNFNLCMLQNAHPERETQPRLRRGTAGQLQINNPTDSLPQAKPTRSMSDSIRSAGGCQRGCCISPQHAPFGRYTGWYWSLISPYRF